MDINHLIKQVNVALEQYDFGTSPNELYDPIRYILDLGGKRIRPVLALTAHHLFANNSLDIVKPACAVEVFHNFTLMHDDIMDEAPLRRGKSTVHEKWNSNIAILSGDVMLVKAYDMLLEAKHNHQYLIQRFNECARLVCEGQQLDMNFETRSDVTVDEYLEMIKLKTAVLLGFSLRLGGILAETSQKNEDLLDELGIAMGLGFQLKDDLLDVYGDPEKVGKQVGGDIISNKKTFLLINAMERAVGPIAEELHDLLKTESFDPSEKVDAVKAIYDQLEIRALTQEKINYYFDQAFDLIDKIDCPSERKAPLKGLISFLVARDK